MLKTIFIFRTWMPSIYIYTHLKYIFLKIYYTWNRSKLYTYMQNEFPMWLSILFRDGKFSATISTLVRSIYVWIDQLLIFDFTKRTVSLLQNSATFRHLTKAIISESIIISPVCIWHLYSIFVCLHQHNYLI